MKPGEFLPFNEIPAAAEHLAKSVKDLDRAAFIALAEAYMKAAARHATLLSEGPQLVGDVLPPQMKQNLFAQLCIVFCRRLQRAKGGGAVVVPVAEVDDTGGWILNLELEQGHARFKFKAERKA